MFFKAKITWNDESTILFAVAASFLLYPLQSETMVVMKTMQLKHNSRKIGA